MVSHHFQFVCENVLLVPDCSITPSRRILRRRRHKTEVVKWGSWTTLIPTWYHTNSTATSMTTFAKTTTSTTNCAWWRRRRRRLQEHHPNGCFGRGKEKRSPTLLFYLPSNLVESHQQCISGLGLIYQLWFGLAEVAKELQRGVRWNETAP